MCVCVTWVDKTNIQNALVLSGWPFIGVMQTYHQVSQFWVSRASVGESTVSAALPPAASISRQVDRSTERTCFEPKAPLPTVFSAMLCIHTRLDLLVWPHWSYRFIIIKVFCVFGYSKKGAAESCIGYRLEKLKTVKFQARPWVDGWVGGSTLCIST